MLQCAQSSVKDFDEDRANLVQSIFLDIFNKYSILKRLMMMLIMIKSTKFKGSEAICSNHVFFLSRSIILLFFRK